MCKLYKYDFKKMMMAMTDDDNDYYYKVLSHLSLSFIIVHVYVCVEKNSPKQTSSGTAKHFPFRSCNVCVCKTFRTRNFTKVEIHVGELLKEQDHRICRKVSSIPHHPLRANFPETEITRYNLRGIVILQQCPPFTRTVLRLHSLLELSKFFIKYNVAL